MKLRFAGAVLLLLGLFAMALAACGGGGDEPASSSGEQGADQAEESRSQPTPSDNPERLKSEAPAVEEGQADVESGIQVDEIRIEPAGLGGKVKVLITNVLQEECTGPVINMDLVDADDGVAGQMGINSSSPLPAGEQNSTNNATSASQCPTLESLQSLATTPRPATELPVAQPRNDPRSL